MVLVPGSSARKPRISPPGNELECTLRYACPAASPAASAASAPAGVPPLAVMNAAFHVEAWVVSKVWSYAPLVTPSGKPMKTGRLGRDPDVAGWRGAAVDVGGRGVARQPGERDVDPQHVGRGVQVDEARARPGRRVGRILVAPRQRGRVARGLRRGNRDEGRQPECQHEPVRLHDRLLCGGSYLELRRHGRRIAPASGAEHGAGAGNAELQRGPTSLSRTVFRRDRANRRCAVDGRVRLRDRRAWPPRPPPPSTSPTAACPASSGPRKRVVIAGAGIAGLAAAEALLRAGHDPVLLEAQQRVGGRIYTMRAPFAHGLYAEAGAMRIPRAHKLTLAYVEKFGLRTFDFTMNNPQAWVPPVRPQAPVGGRRRPARPSRHASAARRAGKDRRHAVGGGTAPLRRSPAGAG